MQSAIDYMEDHLLEPLNIESIARKAGYSAFHFMRMFNIDSFDYYMTAFEKAVEEKCDGIETDVQFTKDGEMVLCQDRKSVL